MTVIELIEELTKFDPKLEVVGTWDSGYGRIESILFDEKSKLVLLDVSEYEAFDD